MKGSLEIEAGGGTAVTFASQAEAEAGTDNTKAMTPLRVAEAIATFAGGGGGGGVSDTGVFYVRADGNDATGDGTAGNPFATITKAAELRGDGKLIIDMGPGSYGIQTIQVGDAAVDITIRGRGMDCTRIEELKGEISTQGYGFILEAYGISITTITAEGVVAKGNFSVDYINASPTAALIPGTPGNICGAVALDGNIGPSVIIDARGQQGYGAPGVVGTNGGQGGLVILRNGAAAATVDNRGGQPGDDYGVGTGDVGGNGLTRVMFASLADDSLNTIKLYKAALVNDTWVP